LALPEDRTLLEESVRLGQDDNVRPANLLVAVNHREELCEEQGHCRLAGLWEPPFLKLKTALFPMICLTAPFSPTKLSDRSASSLTLSLSTARPFAESGCCIRSARDGGLRCPLVGDDLRDGVEACFLLEREVEGGGVGASYQLRVDDGVVLDPERVVEEVGGVVFVHVAGERAGDASVHVEEEGLQSAWCTRRRPMGRGDSHLAEHRDASLRSSGSSSNLPPIRVNPNQTELVAELMRRRAGSSLREFLT